MGALDKIANQINQEKAAQATEQLDEQALRDTANYLVEKELTRTAVAVAPYLREFIVGYGEAYIKVHGLPPKNIKHKSEQCAFVDSKSIFGGWKENRTKIYGWWIIGSNNSIDKMFIRENGSTYVSAWYGESYGSHGGRIKVYRLIQCNLDEAADLLFWYLLEQLLRNDFSRGLTYGDGLRNVSGDYYGIKAVPGRSTNYYGVIQTFAALSNNKDLLNGVSSACPNEEKMRSLIDEYFTQLLKAK